MNTGFTISGFLGKLIMSLVETIKPHRIFSFHICNQYVHIDSKRSSKHFNETIGCNFI